MAALPLRKLDQYDEEAQELPTNELHSGRLQSRPLHVVGAEGEGEEPSNVIDYVSRIASRDTGRLGARPTISLLPPPTGMYHRAAPARMVPARGFSIGGLLKKLGLYLLLPAALVGAVAWAVVTYVGTDWVADILAPPPAAQTETGPVDDGFAPGPDVQPEMNLPPLEGTPIEPLSRSGGKPCQRRCARLLSPWTIVPRRHRQAAFGGRRRACLPHRCVAPAELGGDPPHACREPDPGRLLRGGDRPRA
jgi:hypothetical protein